MSWKKINPKKYEFIAIPELTLEFNGSVWEQINYLSRRKQIIEGESMDELLDNATDYIVGKVFSDAIRSSFVTKKLLEYLHLISTSVLNHSDKKDVEIVADKGSFEVPLEGIDVLAQSEIMATISEAKISKPVKK